MARTFAELRRLDVGFDTRRLLVLRITPDAARYRTAPQTTDYYRRVLDSLREVPAIESVAAVTALPMSTIGSDFTRPYWPEDARPEGKPASQASYQRGPYPYEVVGVVRDARHDGPRSEPAPEIFIPHAQNPYLVMNVVARTALDPWVLAQAARAYALRVDPDQPVHSVTSIDELFGDVVRLDRFNPKTWEVQAAWPVAANRPHGVGWEADTLWVSDSNLCAFFRHDIKTGKMIEKIQLAETDPIIHGATVHDGHMWFCDDVGWVARLKL